MNEVDLVISRNLDIFNSKTMLERKVKDCFGCHEELLDTVMMELQEKEPEMGWDNVMFFNDVYSELQILIQRGSDTRDLVGKAYKDQNTLKSQSEIKSLLSDKDVAKYMDFSVFYEMGLTVGKIFSTEESRFEDIHNILLENFGRWNVDDKTYESKEDKALLEKLYELITQNYKVFCSEFNYNLFVSLSIFVPKRYDYRMINLLPELREQMDMPQ